MNQPFLASVPLPSVVVFAALWPMSLAFCVQFFVGKHVDRGQRFTGVQIVWRTIVIGVLASIGTVALARAGDHHRVAHQRHRDGRGVRAGTRGDRRRRCVGDVQTVATAAQHPAGATESRYSSPLMVRFGLVYLAVMAVLWVTALPAYFGAVDGFTDNGDPIGSLWYTALCFVIAGLSAVAALTVSAAQTQKVPARVSSTAISGALTYGQRTKTRRNRDRPV